MFRLIRNEQIFDFSNLEQLIVYILEKYTGVMDDIQLLSIIHGMATKHNTSGQYLDAKGDYVNYSVEYLDQDIVEAESEIHYSEDNYYYNLRSY